MKSANAAAAASTGALQSPAWDWRNNRMLGYQGLSVRSNIHRQSGTLEIIVHTGLPIAPAR